MKKTDSEESDDIAAADIQLSKREKLFGKSAAGQLSEFLQFYILGYRSRERIAL